MAMPSADIQNPSASTWDLHARRKDSVIRQWIQTGNKEPRPFAWRKTADEILESLATYCERISGSGH